MARFALLLHESPAAMEGISPEEIQAVIQEYTAWREQIEQQGRLAAGEKLEDGTARHLIANEGRIDITDGPYTEAKEVLGGFFLIQAEDWPDAVEISKGCPHLKYGGRIELRRIDEIH
jgi:hypothetical protein